MVDDNDGLCNELLIAFVICLFEFDPFSRLLYASSPENFEN